MTKFYIHTDIKTLVNFLSFCRLWFGDRKISEISEEEYNKVFNIFGGLKMFNFCVFWYENGHIRAEWASNLDEVRTIYQAQKRNSAFIEDRNGRTIRI